MLSGHDHQPPEGADAEPDSASFAKPDSAVFAEPDSAVFAEPDSAVFAGTDFVGPLRPAEQAWAEHVLRADNSAALFESSDVVIRRREAHISGLYRIAALLSLGGDLRGSSTAGFRAVAESRALADFMANSPAYCLECFLLDDRCERHQAEPSASSGGSVESEVGGTGSSGSGADQQQPGHQPEWRRFGAEEFPSAGG
jgi:hypothetical protein